MTTFKKLMMLLLYVFYALGLFFVVVIWVSTIRLWFEGKL